MVGLNVGRTLLTGVLGFDLFNLSCQPREFPGQGFARIIVAPDIVVFVFSGDDFPVSPSDACSGLVCPSTFT